MSKIRLLPYNLWRGGSIISQSSQNPQFPAIDTQIDSKQMYWRSLTIEKLTDGGLNLWDDAVDLTHWTESISGTSTVNREATEKIEGDYSCRLDVDGSNNETEIYQSFTLRPNVKYQINLSYFMSIAGKTAQFRITDTGYNVYLQDDATWGGINWIDLSNYTAWKLFELVFSAHPDYSDYVIAIQRKSAASSSIYFDKLSLVECPSISNDIGEFSPAGKGLMNYDSGSVEPVVGEGLYGECASGKVVSVTKSTGEWGDGDATGSIELEKCEGCFNDNENIRGSIGGTNILTVNHPDGAVGVDRLVKNGAFVHVNNPPNDWTVLLSSTLTTEAGGKIGNCLMITEGGEANPYTRQKPTVEGGKIYKFKAYVKAGTEATYQVYIEEDTGGSAILFNTGQLEETAGDWSTEITATFKPAAGVTRIEIRLYQVCGAAAGTTIYYDEVTLYELDEDDTEKKVDFIAILGHNFSQTAVIKAIGSMESDFSDTVEEVVIPYNEDNIFYFFPSAVTRRYWKLEVTDADNVDGYIQAATIIMGNYFEPEWSYIKPHSEGRDIASEFEFTDSMVLYAHEKPTRKVWLLNFRLTEAEKDKVLELIEENENHKAFIACFDSDNPNLKSCLVKLRAVEEPGYISYDRWRWEAPIIEVL